MGKVEGLDEFLNRNRIEKLDWDAANIEWSLLKAIADDHTLAFDQLTESASMFAKLMQRFDGVHSVRWRIKDSEHLLEKIVRKRAKQIEKYLAISTENYFEIVTDLVGIRALHLYKEDCLQIDQSIRNSWKLTEDPVAYVREGDPEEVQAQFREQGFKVENHPAGYRSVHYITESSPFSRKVMTEIQVRTVFEEGWSEIDHDIRYPNFSKNGQVEYFLAIFNRLAGSADEMGSFVRSLTGTLKELECNLVAANEEKQRSVLQMEEALAQLANATNKDKAAGDSIKKLQAEVAKLRAEASNSGGLLSSNPGKAVGVSNLGLGLSTTAAATLSRYAGSGIINDAMIARHGLGLLGSSEAAAISAIHNDQERAADALKRALGLGTNASALRDAVARFQEQDKLSTAANVVKSLGLTNTVSDAMHEIKKNQY